MTRSFNEAAALHRGKPPRWRRCCAPWSTRFNEAAALHRGKPFQYLQKRKGQILASMRPRHYTAENEVDETYIGGKVVALQ